MSHRPQICTQCGGKYMARTNKNKPSKFCSQKCNGASRVGVPMKPEWSAKQAAARTASRLAGKWSHAKGPDHHNWKGGSSVKDTGYRYHTSGPLFGMSEHRSAMERHLGRPLRKDEIIHHINRDKLDNRIENLRVMTRSEHVKLHQEEDMAMLLVTIVYGLRGLVLP